MNLPFWYGRVIFWGVGLSLVIIGLRKLSIAQDTDPNPGTTRLFKARFHSTYTLIIFALTITFTGFDFVMGLDYKWFSTMWGVYLFAGSALNSMAVIILVCTWLQEPGPPEARDQPASTSTSWASCCSPSRCSGPTSPSRSSS